MKLTSFLSRCVLAVLLLGGALGPIALSAAEQKPESAAAAVAPININIASADLIAATLTGVGQKRAESIIAYRKAHGDFESFDDLLEVKGIGAAVIKKNQHLISFH